MSRSTDNSMTKFVELTDGTNRALVDLSVVRAILVEGLKVTLFLDGRESSIWFTFSSGEGFQEIEKLVESWKNQNA